MASKPYYLFTDITSLSDDDRLLIFDSEAGTSHNVTIGQLKTLQTSHADVLVNTDIGVSVAAAAHSHTGMLSDAPNDGKYYLRRNGAWEELAIS